MPGCDGTFGSCYGTLPGCDGTFGSCYETLPDCDGTFPSCYAMFPDCYGTGFRRERLLSRIYPPQAGLRTAEYLTESLAARVKSLY